MNVLHYSNRDEDQDYILHCMAIPQVLSAIRRRLLSSPIFPTLKRLVITIVQPRPWLEDLLPCIPSASTLQILSFEYHARYWYPSRILDFVSRLSEITPAILYLKLKLYARLDGPGIDLFMNSNCHANLHFLNIDCPHLSSLSLSRIADFPSLKHLKVRLEKSVDHQFYSSSTLLLPHLEKLNLTATEAILAVKFFQCISIGGLPQVTHITIYISQTPPLQWELSKIGCQIHDLCSSTSLKHLEISSSLAYPSMPDQPTYNIQSFLPLINDFSLTNLTISIQRLLSSPCPRDISKMASSWANLVAIKIDPGCLTHSNRLEAISICHLTPFIHTCKRLRQLYIPFKHVLSEQLPPGIHAECLSDLGLGYMIPGSNDASIVGRWLRIVAPRLLEIALVDAEGEVMIHNIGELLQTDKDVEEDSDDLDYTHTSDEEHASDEDQE